MRTTLRTVVVLAAAFTVAAASMGEALAHCDHHHNRVHKPVHVDATFVYEDGTSKALIGDRGEITAVAADSLTMLRADDVSVTVAITEQTCIRVDGEFATWDQLVVGDRVAAISQANAVNGLDALVIRGGTPLFKPGRPNCDVFAGAYHGDGVATFANGETQDYAWDRGRISGITPHRIRIERVDGESVTAEVNRWTQVSGVRSYRNLNLGEPVWLVSLKVDGDPEDLLAKIIRRIRP